MDTCPRITGKDYENAGSDPLVNNDTIIKGLRDIFKIESRLRNKEDFEQVCMFYGDNIPYFKQMWGRQSCCWTGYGRFWIWKHELDYCDLYALVAPERGTSYEVVVHDGQDELAAGELEGFFAFLLEGLKELKRDQQTV
jgi:hypothetical protein